MHDFSGKPFSTILSKIGTPILLIVASILFVTANSLSHEEISPFDEYVYIDYLAKFPEQGVVVTGEETGDFARNYVACAGVTGYGKFDPTSCGTGDHSDDEAYPFSGKTSADLYTPLYFALTWLAAQPLTFLGLDLVEAGRAAGWVWLGSAALFLFYSLKRLSITTLGSASAALLLVASVPAWWSTTFISTDGSALTSGSALMFAGIYLATTGKRGWMLPVISILAVALKLQNFMAVVATAGFLLILKVRKSREDSSPIFREQVYQAISRDRLIVTLGSMLVLPILLQLIWVLIRKWLAVDEFPDQLVARPLGIQELVTETVKFYGRVGMSSTVPDDAVIGFALAAATTWVLIAGVISVIAVEPRFNLSYSIALSVFVTFLLAGPALSFASLLAQGFYFPLPERYGLSLLPFALGMAGVLLDKKIETRIALLALAGSSFAFSLTPYFPGL